MALTRAQIKIQAQLLADEVVGKPGFGQPFSWDLITDMVTDEIARLGAYFKTSQMDVTSAVASYLQPGLWKIRSIVVTNSATASSILPVVRPEEIDVFLPSWRSAAPSGTPQYVVMEGIDNLVLYPGPNYNFANGIVVKGYATPSNAGTAGANIWPLATDNCPLSERMHYAVVTGVAAMRCEQYPSPENATRVQTLQARYQQHKDMIRSEVLAANPSLRFDDGTDASNYPQSTGTKAR